MPPRCSPSFAISPHCSPLLRDVATLFPLTLQMPSCCSH
jgi:hypothetical protein